MDDSELNEKDEEINSNHRSRRIQSIGGGSPLIKKSTSGRRKSQTKSVTIKTSTSSVPTPILGRNDGVSSSSGNDIILHVGGSAWTKESLAYEAAMNDDGENSRPSSAHGGERNTSYRKSIDQSRDLSYTKTKVAGEYVQSISDQLCDGEKSDDFSHIKFVAEQQSDRKNVNIEIVEKAFKEYKADINQSLSDLDTKINHLDGMIKLLVDRIPTVPHSDVKKSVGEKED